MVRISGKRAPVRSSVGTNSVSMKRPLPRTNLPTCMIGVPSGAASLHGHWIEPSRSILAKETPAKVGVSARDLVHDLGGVRVVHRVAERVGERLRGLPVGHAGERRDHLAHAADAALGVGEGAVLLQERRAGQEDMRVLRRLVQEEVLHDDAFHRLEPGGDVLRVGVGLGDVLALDVDALEGAVDRLVEHVGDAQARLVASGTPQSASKVSRTASSETWR